MTYQAAPHRYDAMIYNRCGKSGLKLPAISLGLWHNFGDDTSPQLGRDLCRTAFDLGITHFDLANNYGPPPGSAERRFGDILDSDFASYRDELIISTKAGYDMWSGPYGTFGSRKSMLASLDQSLVRMGLDYVDIYYAHRFDPDTPLEETMGALATAVTQGKALYVGISSFSARHTQSAAIILNNLGVPCLIHQPSYSMLNRWVETTGLLDCLTTQGMGGIAFSPLAQGMLTEKYIKDVPTDSRAARGGSFDAGFLSDENLARIRGLNDIAQARGQSLAQMALAWVLRQDAVTSALIGASRPEQIKNCVDALKNLTFTQNELTQIDAFASESHINLWAASSQTE